MAHLELTRKVLKVKYDGKEYDVRKPSSRQISDFANNSKKDVEALVEFLAQLGFPADVAWDIEAENLRLLVEQLMPKIDEKKS